MKLLAQSVKNKDPNSTTATCESGKNACYIFVKACVTQIAQS